MKADDPTFTGTADEKGRITFERPSQVCAYIAKKFAGKVVDVQIRDHQEKRSHLQNAGFHAMVMPWAREEGHRIEDLKYDLLREVFGEHESVSVVTGEVRMALNEPHTSKLTVAQFSELIERTLDIAADCGVILVAPDEYRRAKEAEAKKAARDARKAQKAA